MRWFESNRPSQTPVVNVPHPLIEARFLQRLTRFSARVRPLGRRRSVLVHIPNSGRLQELLVPGRRIWYHPTTAPHRKTGGTVLIVETDRGNLASIDARKTPQIFWESVGRGIFPDLQDARLIRFEPGCVGPLRRHRLDLLLSRNRHRVWVEAKSITLVIDGTGYYPDAPSARGARHMQLLLEHLRAGDEAMVVFVVQRDDAERVSILRSVDPDLYQVLRQAHRQGVKIYALRCRVRLDTVLPDRAVPFDWSAAR